MYSYGPLMWRTLRKISAIVREEMDRAGAQEVLLPILQPQELWQERAAADTYLKAGIMFHLKDRKGADLCLGPTAEEVVTDFVRRDVESLQAAAGHGLPDQQQVPRRVPAALRPDARARVHHEGRLLLRRATTRASTPATARCARPTCASSSAAG